MEEPILSHWTTREVPNHSLIKRHLCCFKYFPIANITTNTINIDLLYLHKYICRLKFPKVELLGQKICIFIILIATARLTSMEITHLTFPWEIWEGFPWGTGGTEPPANAGDVRCKETATDLACMHKKYESGFSLQFHHLERIIKFLDPCQSDRKTLFTRVILIYISLILRVIEHHYIHLRAICISFP